MTGPETPTFPRISDGRGYQVRPQDLDFLRISRSAIEEFYLRRSPLGMSPDRFSQFISTLRHALSRDRLSTCDIRLQGSAARFFSGVHKTMPWTRPELIETFRSLRGRLPESWEIDEIERVLQRVWPAQAPRPSRRPFDALFVLGLDRQPSDYDLQISSDEIVARARARIAELNIEPSRSVVSSRTYAFVRKDLVVDTCPHLALWATRQTDILGRLVSVAAFPASGPPDVSAEADALSAHFREDDWLIRVGRDAAD